MAPLRRLLPAGGMLLLFACCQAQNADQQSLGGVHKAGWLHQHAHQVKVDPNAPEDVAYKAKKTVWTNDLAEQQKVAYKHQEEIKLLQSKKKQSRLKPGQTQAAIKLAKENAAEAKVLAVEAARARKEEKQQQSKALAKERQRASKSIVGYDDDDEHSDSEDGGDDDDQSRRENYQAEHKGEDDPYRGKPTHYPSFPPTLPPSVPTAHPTWDEDNEHDIHMLKEQERAWLEEKQVSEMDPSVLHPVLSGKPTTAPTFNPTASVAPTSVPTINLGAKDDDDDGGYTTSPTFQPSFYSFAPTRKSTPSPTSPPTQKQTVAPTSWNTVAPKTTVPTLQPTAPTSEQVITPAPTQMPTTPATKPIGEDPNDPCTIMWKRVEVDCKDLSYHGSWCVKLCTKRMNDNPEYAVERASCPIMWRRKLGKELCWSVKNCEPVMDYFCGDFKGKALSIPTSTGVDVKVDGCDFCINHYVWREPPIYNYGCFMTNMYHASNPYCKRGVSPEYLKESKAYVKYNSHYQKKARSKYEANMVATGEFKDDTGKIKYTP